MPTDILFALPAVFIVGGIAQVLAAMWSFRKGDTLAATAFGAFGSFNVLFAWQYWLIPTRLMVGPTQGFADFAKASLLQIAQDYRVALGCAQLVHGVIQVGCQRFP